MNFKEYLNQITEGDLRHVYLLGGEEKYLLKEAEKAVIKAVFQEEDSEESQNISVFYGDPDLKELIASIETVPFFSSKNLIIVRETSLFKTNLSKSKSSLNDCEDEDSSRFKNPALERLITLLGNVPPYSYVLFISREKPDKRKRIYKALEEYGVIIQADPLRGSELRGWLLEKLAEMNIKMSVDAKEFLLFAVSMMPQVSLDFLNNEIEKIILYNQANSNNIVTLPKLREIFSKVPEISIFTMVEALRQKKLSFALELLQEQLTTGKHPVQILALLSKQVSQMLQTKELLDKGYAGKQVAAYFKLPPFIGEKLVRQSQNFSAGVLAKAIINMANADYRLKSGRSGPHALEGIIIELCR